MTLTDTFKSVRRAAGTLADMTDDERNAVLADVADAIVAGKERLLAANGADLARMDKANPLYDRLRLTAERLDACCRRRWAARATTAHCPTGCT